MNKESDNNKKKTKIIQWKEKKLNNNKGVKNNP